MNEDHFVGIVQWIENLTYSPIIQDYLMPKLFQNLGKEMDKIKLLLFWPQFWPQNMAVV